VLFRRHRQLPSLLFHSLVSLPLVESPAEEQVCNVGAIEVRKWNFCSAKRVEGKQVKNAQSKLD
jgi:hypothetical protein